MSIKSEYGTIEAILFTMGESVELGKIAEAIELDKKQTRIKVCFFTLGNRK